MESRPYEERLRRLRGDMMAPFKYLKGLELFHLAFEGLGREQGAVPFGRRGQDLQ